MALDLTRQKIAQSLVTWTIAALIAGTFGVVAVALSWHFVNEHKGESRECSSKPCFVIVETRLKDITDRLSKIESKSHPATSKRFNSDDATALELRMIKCHNRPDWHLCLTEERAAYEKSKK